MSVNKVHDLVMQFHYFICNGICEVTYLSNVTYGLLCSFVCKWLSHVQISCYYYYFIMGL